MLRSTLSSWREYLTPITNKSTFLVTGQITPLEFQHAGDYLVSMFPIWKWNNDGSNINFRDFLPHDKQFLVCRKVPCHARAQSLIDASDKYDFDNDEFVDGKDGEINKEEEESIDDIDELIQDMEIKSEDDDVVNGHTMLKTHANENQRYYDLYITYSTSYRVPKMYIVGFGCEGTPLTSEEMFQDITMEYRDKTATIEKLPFFKVPILSVSIHPCKHANVMKTLLEKVRLVNQKRRRELEGQENHIRHDDDEWEDLQDDVNDTLKIDQYLVVFLKFISSVTPTIEHDYTMEGW
ncbi:hypothetical protein KAFR_0F00920 [Kazachstania africana CBS 2517]|uniref:Autophagy-related protein 3 n=1 Tax=Kazachstania africana (strain ATCC 22294 / BCRC 22015 / CBS 2517 / CECT 1963 / NBRC 1671 / NRRL Y-8276) TaxID=1071382 RepID=H2AWD9_KAZAF|nr:hypothetical protein KAFR_0F00920 [Kazachstania africana CBS 2517]CCF58689.1 hypothetical protein KAFR_0F00920 [Kazachstania africana CBS 2517]